MICYKDTTFCSFSSCKNFSTCGVALTEKVKADAIAWWGSNDAAIAQFAAKPKCFEKENNVGVESYG